jgi:hypothetical protein
MKLFTALCAGALLIAGTAALADSLPEDTSAGIWKLNLEKSTFGSRQAPRSEIRKYTVTPKGTRVVITDINNDGSTTISRTVLTYDGKPHPFTGSPNYDAASTQRQSKYETTADMYLKRKVVGSLRRVVSEDGKTMTMNMKLNKADGTQEMTMSVFDKQP